MSHSEVSVAVVGGGPGGLTLANALQRGGVPVAVLERDPSPAARVRGGPLDLHADSGQIAVRAAGCYDAWRALARSEDEVMTLRDQHGAALLTMPPSPEGEGNPEIDRTQLRDLLLDGLTPGTVVWGAAVSQVAHRPDGRREVRWDGGSVVADLVVGADGAWSRVRPLLSTATPEYSGVTFIEFTVPRVDPGLAALYGRGTTMAQGPFRSLATQRLADGSAWAFAGVRVPEGWGDGFPQDDPAAARSIVTAVFDGWSPRLLALLDAGEPPFTVRRIRALPVGHSWPTTPGLTLIGDAAHVMSPFGGQGANLAMLDAADLAAAVIDADATPGGLAAAVAGYEATMIPRAAEAAELARTGIERSLDADAPASSLAYLCDVAGVEPTRT